ncbi:hypothetical protein BDY19DRAFT_1073305 [Irpex rosettiformis]|uniref:Uncharacterized protein n=1 Tax=Irpex rosettiformis TaxID=378272 RepID=A0ACB8U024_9APHY|nr:hypothetical protein BDY19DRAFT_1073305 [Irpex rosettiformis]
MHLIWENVTKNLMLLWSGAYKGLNAGTGHYEFTPEVWEAIGKASADSGSTIPLCFGPRPPNVASEKSSWTADSRSFWTLFVGPVVLRDRFADKKYYDHFVDFVRIIQMCLQFDIPVSDVAKIRTGFIEWVKKYEEYVLYYQHDPSRLSACPLTIHALLHIADSIVIAGPVWASWAFPMERYCGSLQHAFKSRRFPFAAANRYVLDCACLSHIRIAYASSIRDQLTLNAPELGGYHGALYENCALLPSSHERIFGRGILDKIVGALCTRFSLAAPAIVRNALPHALQEWERIRFLPEGDIVSAAAYRSHVDSVANTRPDARNNTFVRYEQIVDLNSRFRNLPSVWAQKPFFGQLMHIIAVDIPDIPSLNIPSTRVVLAAIRSCKVTSSHEILDIHYYSEYGPLDLVDLTTIQCIVGRVYDRGQWGIIDRSGSLNRAMYIEDE